MANTFTQIHIQLIFVVKFRKNLISPNFKEPLYKYITGIVKNNGHKLLIINGMPDHMHILLGLRPVQALSDLVKEIKQHSSKWINTRQKLKHKFAWQPGFGAFSYSMNDIPRVINYIKNQEEHHKGESFKSEYLRILKTQQVNYDERYLFDFL